MNPLTWPLWAVLAISLGYWLLVVAGWIAVTRLRANAIHGTVGRRDGDDYEVSFEVRVRPLPVAAVLFGPPVALIVSWLIVG